jgi:UDP-GlcNAc:undecaprenyl-phosphate/decaprenyl-phosphate GlcNAc-1-phosphate transferase
MIYFYPAFFVTSFVFSFLINSFFLRFSKNLGIRDNKETVISCASTSKPAFGGISFYIVFLISFASYSIFFQAQEVLLNKKIVGLLVTVTVAFMMGLADDAYNTKPFLKFFVQVLCGSILCYSGIHIGIFQSMTLNYIITIIWVVGIMNSVNMLDNMDSIAAIVAIMIFAAAALLIFLSNTTQNNIHFLILIGLIGSLFGFLIFNWHPAKLYMGDTGSQVIGLMLATIGIIYFWNNSSSMSHAISVSKQLIVVVTAFILPIADTTIVVMNRLASKRSPFVGGRDHTTHNLFFRGVTEKRIAILFGGIGVLSLIIIYYVQTQIMDWGAIQFIFFAVYPITIFLSLFAVTKTKKPIIYPSTLTKGSKSSS